MITRGSIFISLRSRMKGEGGQRLFEKTYNLFVILFMIDLCAHCNTGGLGFQAI